MGIDTSIYNNLLRPPKSVAEYDAEAMEGQQNRLMMQMQRQKVDEYTRGVADEQAQRSAVAGFGADKNANLNMLYKTGNLKAAQGYEKSNADISKVQAEAEKEHLVNVKERWALLNNAIAGSVDQNSYTMNRQALAAQNIDVSQIPEQFDPAFLANAKQQALTEMQRVDQIWKSKKYDLDVRQQGEVERNNMATVAESARGHTLTANTAAAGRAQSAQQFAVSSGQRNQELQIKTGGKPMTAAQEAKYRTQIAKDYQAANTILSNMDEVAASAKAVKEAPGLGGATGLQAYLPSYPDGQASQAEVKLANLEGKVTSLGKAAAAMSGAVGPMAVQEWKIVRDMIAAIDPKKGEKSLKEQIELVEENARGAADRIRDAYGKHYSADFERYPQFEEIKSSKPKAPAPATPPAKPRAAPIQLKSAADYAKVPSGAEFITPDGQTMRKK